MDNLELLNDTFEDEEQQDASELFVAVMARLAVERGVREGQTVLGRLFSFFAHVTLACPACGSSSRPRHEMFTHQSLPVPDSPSSVTSLLASLYCEAEAGIVWACPGCERSVAARRSVRLRSAPQRFVIVLGRHRQTSFDYEPRAASAVPTPSVAVKRTSHVSFDAHLNSSAHSCTQLQVAPPRCTPSTASSCTPDQRLGAGTFMYIRVGGLWFLMNNDDVPVVVAWATVAKAQAFMLFYSLLPLTPSPGATGGAADPPVPAEVASPAMVGPTLPPLLPAALHFILSTLVGPKQSGCSLCGAALLRSHSGLRCTLHWTS